MQPARTLLAPVITRSFKLGVEHQWQSKTTDSTLTRIWGIKMGTKRAITFNFEPYGAVYSFCSKYGFDIVNAAPETGSITLLTPTETQKACTVAFAICDFTQESDKKLLQEIVKECPPVRSLEECRVSIVNETFDESSD